MKKTDNYGLTHYEPQDHPDFLTDYNRDMEIIDQIMAQNADNNSSAMDDIKTLQARCDNLQSQINMILLRVERGKENDNE